MIFFVWIGYRIKTNVLNVFLFELGVTIVFKTHLNRIFFFAVLTE